MARPKLIKWKGDLPSSREWQDRTRAKINAGMLIDRLTKCAAGNVELSTAAVSAAKTLLDRVLPSLTSADISQTPSAPLDYAGLVSQLSVTLGPEMVADLLARLAGKQSGANRTSGQPETSADNAHDKRENVSNQDNLVQVAPLH